MKPSSLTDQSFVLHYRFPLIPVNAHIIHAFKTDFPFITFIAIYPIYMIYVIDISLQLKLSWCIRK